MAQKIQLRTDTAANWTSVNPVLAISEMAVESDTAKFKLGNGSTAWNALAYGGVQGPAGTNGTNGANGPTGASGVIAATAPLTYNSGTQTMGVDSTSVITTTTQTLSNKTLTSPVLGGAALENAYLNATGFAGYTFYATTNGSVQVCTPSSTSNGTINITSTSGQTLNALMATGQTITCTLVLNNATAYYITAITVDGSVPGVIRWSGGTAPTSGNINAFDVYTFTLIKTGTSSWWCLASQSKFA